MKQFEGSVVCFGCREASVVSVVSHAEQSS